MPEERSNRDTPFDPSDWDPKALIETHYQGVWRYLRAIGCSADLADDISQETFVAVLKRPFEQFHANSTAAYLRRVAFHLMVTAKRQAGKMIATDELEVLDRIWTRWVGADLSGDAVIDALTECFSRLTPRAQQSLRMRYADNASREDIAESLKITSHGVKNLQQRAKAQLRECLEEKLNPS